MTGREDGYDYTAKGADAKPSGLVARAMDVAYAAQDAAPPTALAEVREVVAIAIHDEIAPPALSSRPAWDAQVQRACTTIISALTAAGYTITRADARPAERTPFAPGEPVVVQQGTSAERDDTIVECMRETDGPGWSVRLASGIWVSAECCTARDASARPAVGKTWETPNGAVMVVPVEPSEEMIDSGSRAIRCGVDPRGCDKWDTLTSYRAMLAAIKEPRP